MQAFPLTLRGFAFACSLVLILAATALLPGCGGGSLTPEESAQHDADTAALAALSTDRKTIQAPNCSSGACR